jgi:Putative zinc-finger
MNCQGYEEQIGDHADGTLPAAEAVRLGAHLAACAACRAVAADFAVIRSMARTLEPQVPPPYVWVRVAAATRTRGRWSLLGFGVWQPAAAAAMSMVLATGLWWVGGRLSVVSPAVPAVAGEGALADLAGRAAEAHYTRAIASLEELTSAERASLDPDMVSVLDGGMTAVDTAIDQSRAALAVQPDSTVAQESLFQALRTKVTLLQNTLTLVNEQRLDGDGNPDAARSLPEIN